MISFTYDQLSSVIATFLFPFVRLLSLSMTAPIFGDSRVPGTVKIGLAGIVALTLAPVIGPAPSVSPFSWEGLWILAQQMMIGAALGWCMQLVFSAVSMAGDFVGLQMGLSFATLLNPNADGSTAVLGMLLNVVIMLVFLATNGHLVMYATLVQSFTVLPISGTPISVGGWHYLAMLGGQLFTLALMLSLPLVAALLICNLALGILNRAAPQLNIFAVGFPLTLGVGLVVLELMMPRLAPVMDHFVSIGIDMMMRATAAFVPKA
ncbi:flagellar biosynthetic protein FliR [Pandoraea aquatica]|uniref:Flagellar biosynthetic protein FliR n=1 Tax=Pandoraea aquatica TaxID=2508290 RepID=A0A5E4YRR9_9BURK|nr:flagellar biosynthetic protein FliR [Pandoraea aquatica]VVE51197.1 flagellar biosynthetic protein FliR [Pandoraea aquatica]